VRLDTKAQIARTTLSLLTIVVSLFFLGVLVLVLCVGLQINPFRETTTSFLLATFAALIGAAVVLVLLNVASNMSLLADAKIAELHIEPRSGVLKKWAIAFGVVAVGLVALVFAGTYLSKERYLAVVHSQADEVLNANKSSLDEITRALSSGQYDDYKRISEISNFLQNQRSGLPQLTIIYAGMFENKLAFYKVEGYFPYDPQYKTYKPVYFACTPNLDCEYLKKFFSGEKVDILQKYTFREDQFYIYIPYVGKESRFVMLFNRANTYGKLGS
jgi:hypothetical protein